VIRNLEINYTSNKEISKTTIHKVVSELRREFDFKVSSLVINLVSSEEIARINKKYLKHNYSTDIITFDYSRDKKNLDAEIFISVNDAEYNSKKYDVSLLEEIVRLIVHGILHLTGYDDKKKQSRILMKKKENLLMDKFGYGT
jgi:probable rRNA maturation factor